jgi:hypothetical protein
MTMNQTSDIASDVVQADTKHAIKNSKTSRKVISKAKKGLRKAAKRTRRV